MKAIEYKPPPVVSQFHQDDDLFRCILGPVGSAKTTGCLFELFMRAQDQAPNSSGVRQTRWAVIRATYPRLKTTTIQSWKEWFGEIAPVVMDVPIRSRLHLPLNDGTTMDMEIWFIALDRPDDASRLLSVELTGAFINEASEIDEEVLSVLRGRIGRYPSPKDVGASWYGIIADSNYCSDKHWLYRFAEIEKPKGFKFYKQPPAVTYNPKDDTYEMNQYAENLRYLPKGYYANQIAGNKDDYIRRFLCCEYGESFEGKPVFPTFSQEYHVADQVLEPDRTLPVLLGLDWGLNPAVLFCQISRMGTVCITDELAPPDVSLEELLSDYVIPLIAHRYQGMIISAVGDPAGRGRSGLDKRTPFMVCQSYGLKVIPAITNSFVTRKEAVEKYLSKRDGLTVSPHCTQLISALRGGYHYAKMRGSSITSRHSETPQKDHPDSDLADGLQYICLAVGTGFTSQMKRIVRPDQGDERPPERQILWA